MIAVIASSAHTTQGPCIAAPLSIGDQFIAKSGSRETVRKVAQVKYGSDIVGFVYQTSDGRLFAQARSGMPARDQALIGLTPLAAHKTGEKYLYSPIVAFKKNPWNDLIVVFCR